MADKRAFAKFDVGYLDNPKMLDVLDASSSAILMHFASVLYCAQHLTDGVVAAKAMQRKAGGTDADIQILLDAGLWHAPGHDCDGCPEPPEGKVYVHDFLEHNREAAHVKKVSQKRSEIATARHAAEREAMQNALQNDDVCSAERERKKDIKKNPSPKPPASDEFDTFWAAYPRKVGKIAGRKAFDKAMTLTSLETVLQGVSFLKSEIKKKEIKIDFVPHPATWLNDGRWDDEPTQQEAIVVTGPWDPNFHKNGTR